MVNAMEISDYALAIYTTLTKIKYTDIASLPFAGTAEDDSASASYTGR